jgi:vitamin B12 transporter
MTIKGFKSHLLFFLLPFFLSQLAFTQEKIVKKTNVEGLYRLSDVVISATKTQTSSLELASSITVIDSAEIANRNSGSVFELLKNEYGISFTQQGGAGSLSNIYIRGGNSSHTLVLLDGIEINLPSDPSNVYDFANLTTDNIERIEILRGPQSTLYGSNSLAGVINIITRKGIGSPNFSINAEGGSYKTYKSTLGMNGNVEKFNYSVTLGRSESEGFSAASEKYGNTEKDGYRKDNISARFGYDFGDEAGINLFINYLNSTADYDQMGGVFGDDPTYVFDQEEFSFHGEGKLNLFEGKWKPKFGISHFRNIRKYSFDFSEFNAASSHSSYDGQKIKIDWQNNLYLIDNHQITLGLDYEKNTTISEYHYTSDFYLESIFPKKESDISGIFLQDQFKIGQNFFGTAGFRLDVHDKFGSAFTFRIAPAFIIWTTGTKIKATLGTGFNAPSLFYLYDPAYGNPNLNPEKSLGFDAGIEQYFWQESVLLGLTYFQNDYKDLFGFDNNFKTINVKKAKTKGIEVYANSRLSNVLDIKMNYTYTDAKDKSDNVPNTDKKLLRRPEHKAALFVSYSPIYRTNINAELIYVGKREDMNFSLYERVELKSYLITNLAAHYDITNFLRLNIHIENLFDTKYEEVYGYATPGFSVYGGVQLSLNDI